MTGNKSQRDIILTHMIDYGSITSIEAFEDYKVTRISAVIFDLRHKDKINIVMTRDKINVDGKQKTFGIYTLAKGPVTPSLSSGV